jgi:hypothetical protein
VSSRPLVVVLGLTVGDYLLWNWSLSGNHDVPALVAGLSLPPLAAASLWLLVVNAARLIAYSARRAPAIGASRRRELRESARLRRVEHAGRDASDAPRTPRRGGAPAAALEQPAAAAKGSKASSRRRLAA